MPFKRFTELLGLLFLSLFTMQMVHAELINVSIDGVAAAEGSLDGPIYGVGGADLEATWNQFVFGAVTMSEADKVRLVDMVNSAGQSTTVDIAATSDKLWGRGHEFTVLRAGASTWGPGTVQTLTISGLSGASYDLYLCSYESAQGYCIFSTSNSSATVGDQLVDNTLDTSDGTAWIRGANYAVFEDVEPDADHQIVIEFYSDRKDARAFLSGLQIATANTDRVAPGPAISPIPEDQGEGLAPDTDLSWTNGGGAASANVYFGTNPDPSMAEFKGNQTLTTFDPGSLAHGTYYWRIDTVNDEGETPGQVWSFRVGPPGKAIQPMPRDTMPAVSVNATLRWELGERAISSDVYFGTNPAPSNAEFKGNQTETTFEPGPLSPNTTYYWRADQVNEEGTMTSDVWSFTTSDDRPNKMKVFILAGQSNMEGHGEISPVTTQGTLEYLVANDPATYGHLKDGDAWVVRDDTWVIYNRGAETVTELRRWNSVGLGASDRTIGPEFQFGNLMGDRFDEQVLLIKTAWGGRSLGVDFRPPRSGWRSDNPMEFGDDGYYWKLMIEHVVDVVNNMESYFPDYHGNGFEIAGFGWHQGWNDLGADLSQQYEENMANFIKDVRASLGKPKLPFVIATTGIGGGPDYKSVALAQLAIADFDRHPEFEGNVAVRDTRDLFRTSDVSPSSQGYHWNRNAESYYGVGAYLGQEMIKLLPRPDDNEEPVIESPATAAPATITLAATTELTVFAGDPDGDDLTYFWNKLSGPGMVTFSDETADFTTAGFSQTGTYQLEVIISDSFSNISSEVTVLVEAEGGDVSTVEVTTPQDVPVLITLTAPGIVSPTYSIVKWPTNGSLSAVTGDKVKYTPPSGHTGNASFTFTANDGVSNTEPRTVNITITERSGENPGTSAGEDDPGCGVASTSSGSSGIVGLIALILVAYMLRRRHFKYA